MTQVVASLQVADVDAEGGVRPLDVDDFKADTTGAAKEATLASVLTELEALRGATGATTEVTDLTYDDVNGTLVSYVENGTTWTLTYDDDGRLLSVTGS
jgi:YD repeat-containing protein